MKKVSLANARARTFILAMSHYTSPNKQLNGIIFLPVVLSHVPMLLHSARACALFVVVGTSPQALPAGQTL